MSNTSSLDGIQFHWSWCTLLLVNNVQAVCVPSEFYVTYMCYITEVLTWSVCVRLILPISLIGLRCLNAKLKGGVEMQPVLIAEYFVLVYKILKLMLCLSL